MTDIIDRCDQTSQKDLVHLSFGLHAELADVFGAESIGYRRLDTVHADVFPSGAKLPKRQSHTADLPPFLSRDTVRSSQTIGSPDTTAQVHPELLTKALLHAAVDAGVRVLHECVRGVQVEDGCARGVLLADGSVVPASAVVLAMGPWSANAVKWLDCPEISSYKVHSVVFRPTVPFGPCAVFTEVHGRMEHCDPEIYPRPSGDVYVCGYVDETPLPEDPASVQPTDGTCARLVQLIGIAAPELLAAELKHQQACYLPISPDNVPIIGELSVKGAYVATGHGVWGILNGPATGGQLCS